MGGVVDHGHSLPLGQTGDLGGLRRRIAEEIQQQNGVCVCVGIRGKPYKVAVDGIEIHLHPRL